MTPLRGYFLALVSGYIDSKDGIRISYRCEGGGPTVMLIHGGGDTKEAWWRIGYPERLKGYRVIAPDIRGNGDSDRPPKPDDYYIGLIVDDLLRVADACDADRFAVIGFSFGGNVAKYLAAASDRVEKLVIIGNGFGPAAFGGFAENLPSIWRRFRILAEELDHSVLDFSCLTPTERSWVENYHLPSWAHILAQLSHWPVVRPLDLKCPALLVMGSGNVDAVAQAEKYRDEMAEAGVQVELFEGLGHYQEFTDVRWFWTTQVSTRLKS